MSEELPKRVRDLIGRMDAAFDRVDALLWRLTRQGLQRMSRASAEELQAETQTAHNAGLIHIERELERLSTMVTRYLDRDPLFAMEAWRDTINRVWMLNRAARKARAAGRLPSDMLDLVGEARRSYVELDESLTLQPLGAVGWVTDTDFVGVTVSLHALERPGVLASGAGQAGLLEVSMARPTMYFGTDPRRLMNQTLSEAVDVTIMDLAHKAWRFDRAKISSDGRLSIHKDLMLSKAPYRGATAYEELAVDRWVDLLDQLRTRDLDPLGRGGSAMVLLRPTATGPVISDTKASRASVELRDDTGAAMELRVPMRRENNFLIDNLERVFEGEGQRPEGIFGRAYVADGRLCLSPQTAIFGSPVQIGRRRSRGLFHEVHLSLESLGG